MGVGSELLANGMNPAWTTILDGLPTLPGNNTWTGTNTFNGTVITNGPATLNGTVTVNGPSFFTAPVTAQTSVTAYSVNNVGYIAPGINGVVGNGVTDDTTAIQTILNTYNSVLVEAGTYLISSTLTINMPNHFYRLWGKGPYCSNFIASASFSGTAAFRVYSSTSNASDYDIGGFSIINKTAGSGATYGFYLGANNSSYMGGNTKSRIFDTVSSGFAYNFLVQGARMVVWDRCASWNTDQSNTSTSGEFGWYLYVSSSTSFTGDMDFDACQCVAGSTGVCVGITDQGTASGRIAGIKFSKHTFYNTKIGLNLDLSGTNSSINDIWVNPGCQFDGAVSAQCMVMHCNASGSSIFDIHVSGAYFSTANSGGHIKGYIGGSGGNIRNIIILGNSFENNGGQAAVYFSGTNGTCGGVTVSNNFFYGNDNSSGDVIYFESVIIINACGNSMGFAVAVASALIYLASACEDIVACNNNTGGGSASASVTNATSPPAGSTAIANNI